MKILLINPPFFGLWNKNRSLESVLPPLSLLYLAAAAENSGHKVEIFDMHAENSKFDEAIKKAKKMDFVGISSSTPTAKITYKLSQLIKEEDPDIKIIAGGPHPSTLPEEPLKASSVDIVVVGEGDYTFLELLNCIENGGELKEIMGICYKDKKNIVHTPPREPIGDLDKLPFPAYHLVDIKKYFYPYQKRRPLAAILTSRGCPYSCTYCNKSIFGRRFGFRSSENVIDEIIYLNGKHQVKEFLIYDDNFTVIKERALEICNRIIEEDLNITISCINGLRVDRVDYEILSKLKSAGCHIIGYGIESGEQKILDSVKKGTTISQIRKAVMLTKKCGINIVGYFIVGFPSDTEKTILSTINFAKDLNILAKFSVATPYPGTEMFNMLDREKRILTYDWSKYGVHQEPVFNHPTLSQEKIFKLYKQAYRTVYTNPNLIIKEISNVRNIIQFKNLVNAGKNIITNFLNK